MSLDAIDDIDRLKRINKALLNRVESVMDQQGNAFSLFQTAINLEGQVRRRTDELTTALRRVEGVNEELAEAKETAELANRSKTRFLAAASHDVLQPLNAALLSISVLSDLQTSERGKALVLQVERSLDTMNELLGTLLDISRLDAGVVQPIVEPVLLGPILDSLKSDFAPIADQKNLRLRFRASGLAVRSDRTILRRILQNLVSNALRYTSRGGVLVGARRRGDTALLQVSDTGRGIAEPLQQAVFEEFHRGEIASGDLAEGGAGLGLGLSIVKRMATTLDHKLTLVSKVGSGTRFQLAVPIARAPVVAAATPAVTGRARKSGATLAGRNILLLENEPAVIEAMTTLLGAWGCEVAVATNLQEAIDALSDTAWLPDLVIADQHLNQGDLGTAAVEAIRAYTGRRLPALVVTADPTDALEAATEEAGVELMAKPVKPASLRALVTHMMAG